MTPKSVKSLFRIVEGLFFSPLKMKAVQFPPFFTYHHLGFIEMFGILSTVNQLSGGLYISTHWSEPQSTARTTLPV